MAHSPQRRGRGYWQLRKKPKPGRRWSPQTTPVRSKGFWLAIHPACTHRRQGRRSTSCWALNARPGNRSRISPTQIRSVHSWPAIRIVRSPKMREKLSLPLRRRPELGTPPPTRGIPRRLSRSSPAVSIQLPPKRNWRIFGRNRMPGIWCAISRTPRPCAAF